MEDAEARGVSGVSCGSAVRRHPTADRRTEARVVKTFDPDAEVHQENQLPTG
jgi:hypothetical protein